MHDLNQHLEKVARSVEPCDNGEDVGRDTDVSKGHHGSLLDNESVGALSRTRQHQIADSRKRAAQPQGLQYSSLGSCLRYRPRAAVP